MQTAPIRSSRLSSVRERFHLHPARRSFITGAPRRLQLAPLQLALAVSRRGPFRHDAQLLFALFGYPFPHGVVEVSIQSFFFFILSFRLCFWVFQRRSRLRRASHRWSTWPSTSGVSMVRVMFLVCRSLVCRSCSHQSVRVVRVSRACSLSRRNVSQSVIFACPMGRRKTFSANCVRMI